MLIATALDKSLTLPLTGRDPLGIQAIWQHRARDVVPALNAASRRADGFRVLAAGLAWWPIFAAGQHRRATEQSKFFLLFEQAVARSCRTAGKDWRLPGTRGLNSGRPGVWVGLEGRKHYLLDSPLANGVWGIYRGPMIKAKLIDGDNHLEPTIADAIRQCTPQVEGLFRRFSQALDNPAEDTELGGRAHNQLVQDLAAIVEPKLLRREIDGWFVTGASDLCHQLTMLAMETPQASPQWLVKQGTERLAHHRATLMRIRRCERYLATMEAVFEKLCSESGKSLVKAASDAPIDIGLLRQAQADFKDSGNYEGLAHGRHKELANAPLESVAGLGDYLIKHHAKVSDQRKSAPWVTLNEGGAVVCELAVDPPDVKQLNPQKAWRNGYYLDALEALARDVTLEGRA